jgi:hypothetical protein
MSITFQHTIYSKKVERNTVVEHEESLIDSSKGLTFKVFDKINGTIEKYIGKMNSDGTFTMMHIVDDKKVEETYSKDELLQEIKKIESLTFVYEYLKNAKVTQRGGKKKGSYKKSSKKYRSRSK